MHGDQSAELKHIRADDPDGHGRWSFSSQQATLRRLDKAFKAFFARVKEGRTPGFPRFKGHGWFDTVEWPKDGDGCRWDSQPHHPTATFVRLQGIGHVRVHQHRRVLGTVKTISIKLSRKKRGSKRRRKAVARVGEGGWLPNGAAAKSGLNKSILAECGHCVAENRITQAEFACTACGHTAHADVNAAVSILRAGLALRDAAEAA